MNRFMDSCGMILVAVAIFTVIENGRIATGRQVDNGQQKKDRLIVEAVKRLKDYDLQSNPKAKAAVLRHLATCEDSQEYVELAAYFKLRETIPALVEILIRNPRSTAGVKAATLAVQLGALPQLTAIVEGKSVERSLQAIVALGYIDDPAVRAYLLPLVTDAGKSRPIRNAAARSVGRNRLGEKALLSLAKSAKLREDTSFAIGNILLSSGDATIRREASKYFALPAGANAKPFPPVADLLKLKGTREEGKKLFDTTATCAKCHKVRGAGKEVGPDLSEIGSKLSREALYVSILDPSAGISHNYETYLVELASGNVLSGILVSRTAKEVSLKTKEAIVQTIQVDDIELMKKSETSLMPADLVKTMTETQLAHVVEYLTSLKKPK